MIDKKCYQTRMKVRVNTIEELGNCKLIIIESSKVHPSVNVTLSRLNRWTNHIETETVSC